MIVPSATARGSRLKVLAIQPRVIPEATRPHPQETSKIQAFRWRRKDGNLIRPRGVKGGTISSVRR